MKEVAPELVPVLAELYAALAHAADEAHAALGQGEGAEQRCDWSAFAAAQIRASELMNEIRAVQDRVAGDD